MARATIIVKSKDTTHCYWTIGGVRQGHQHPEKAKRRNFIVGYDRRHPPLPAIALECTSLIDLVCGLLHTKTCARIFHLGVDDSMNLSPEWLAISQIKTKGRTNPTSALSYSSLDSRSKVFPFPSCPLYLGDNSR